MSKLICLFLKRVYLFQRTLQSFIIYLLTFFVVHLQNCWVRVQLWMLTWRNQNNFK